MSNSLVNDHRQPKPIPKMRNWSMLLFPAIPILFCIAMMLLMIFGAFGCFHIPR